MLGAAMSGGHGATSTVHRATYHGMPVAVKRFAAGATADSVAHEARLTSRIHHVNVVRLLGMCTDASACDMHGAPLGLSLVMELADGSLRTALAAPAHPLKSDVRKRLLFLAGIANGMRALHSNAPTPVVHGDLKPENLLVVEHARPGPRALICDLGFATRGGEQAGGTQAYMAPELLNGQPPSAASDVFALALCMWEVATLGGDGPLWAVAELLELLAGTCAVRNSLPSTVPRVRAAPWRYGNGVVAALPGAVTEGTAKLAELAAGATAPDVAALVGCVRALVRDAAPSNAAFDTRYTLVRVLLYESFAAETSFFSRASDLSARAPYDAPTSPFRPTWHQPSFQRLGVTLHQTPAEIEWRRRTADAFALYPSFRSAELPGVRVHTVFHCPSGGWDVARSICASGFAQLSTTDSGFFSQGYYFSFDLGYVVREYGVPDADGNVAVIVCHVVVGNLYPVIEVPATHGGDAARSLEGKPPVPKYDAHGILVDHGNGCVPCPPAQWADGRTMYSELVVFDTSSILPRGVIAVRPPAAWP